MLFRSNYFQRAEVIAVLRADRFMADVPDSDIRQIDVRVQYKDRGASKVEVNDATRD